MDIFKYILCLHIPVIGIARITADFPGPTVALFTNIFFYNRTDDNKLLSFCLLVVSQIYSAMSYYRYLQNVSCQVFHAKCFMPACAYTEN